MTRRGRLRAFLVEAFEDGTLQSFTEENLDGASSHVAWTGGLDAQSSQLVRWIKANNRFADLWSALREVRPTLLDQIKALEAEWAVPKNAIARPFTFLRDVPLVGKIGGAVALLGIVGFVVVKLVMPKSALVVVMLAGPAQTIASHGGKFAVEVDGKKHLVPREGLSIGKGPVLPDSVARQYHDLYEKLPGATPEKFDIRVTTSSSIVVSYENSGGTHLCKRQPSISAGDQAYVVQWGKDCDPSQ